MQNSFKIIEATDGEGEITINEQAQINSIR